MITEQKIVDILNDKYSDIKEELKLEQKPVFAHLTKDNSADVNNPAILFFGEKGIFVCIMNYPEAEEIVALRKITFDNIKGLKIEKSPKWTKINLLTNNGGHFIFAVPNAEEIKGYESFDRNKKDFLNSISRLETEDKIKAIDNLKNKKLSSYIKFFAPLIAIIILFFRFSQNMGRLEFFLKLIGLIILYYIGFAVVKAGMLAFKDRDFTKEFHLIMNDFTNHKDNEKLYTELKNIKSKPINIKNANTYNLSLAIACYGMGEDKEAKEVFAKIVFDDKTMAGFSENEKMQYLHLKKELYK